MRFFASAVTPPAPVAAPAAAPMGQVCHKCGTPNASNAKFCRKCGERFISRPGTGNLAPNTLIANRFLIVRRIAQGGQGSVYLVVDTHLKDAALQRDKPWALKEMSQSSVPPEQVEHAVKMFQREASMLAHLDHVNLPRVIDCFEHDAKHYLVMDYIEGETLERMLGDRGTAFPLSEVVPWVRQLIGVLLYLHSQNPAILYRDLKPGNIMRDRHGTLKLIDFGIARFKRTTTNIAGGSGELQGVTPGYAPPEQWKTGEVTPAVDVYALGVTLHQLLTNYNPSQSPTPFQLPLACDINPNVPRPVAEMLARAHDPSLQKRIQTMREFEREFEQALQSARGQRPLAGGGNPATPPHPPGNPPINFAAAELRAPRIIHAQTRFQARRLKQAAWYAANALADRMPKVSLRLRGWDRCGSSLFFAEGRQKG